MRSYRIRLPDFTCYNCLPEEARPRNVGSLSLGCAKLTPRVRYLVVLRKSFVMRSSRVSTESPSLSTVDARSGSREIPTAFPAPVLPGLSRPAWSAGRLGTIRSSDSLSVICLRRLFHFSGILDRSHLEGMIRPRTSGPHWLPDGRNVKREWGADSGSPRAARRSRGAGCCLRACTNLGQNPTGTKFLSFPVHSRVATHDPFILTVFLCTLQPTTSAFAL